MNRSTSFLYGPAHLTFLIMVFICLSFSASLKAVDATKEPLILQKFPDSELNMKVDGKLEESIWQNLPYFDHMLKIEPDTLEQVDLDTKARLFYTDEGLYLGVWCEQDPQTLISRLSSRDLFISRDDVHLTLDPSGEGLYGYWFSVTLGGTLQDGTVLPERQFSTQWDGPWRGSSHVHESGWSAEFFLPWSMMSMPEASQSNTPGKRRMAFYLSRSVAHRNERWAWPALPWTKGVFMSQLQPIELDAIEPKQQLTFYPYASATYNNPDNEDSYKAGFDLFWRPTSNLQFTASINPDFGNVESDDVVVNLTSFETFYPEKRAFFLEGNDIFFTSPRARQGRFSRGAPTTLVNTRRIGGPPVYPALPDLQLSGLEENQPTELEGALKVTGQQGQLRYGILAALEDDTKLEGTVLGANVELIQKGREFAIARVLYEDTSGAARKSIGWIGTSVRHPQIDSVVHGVDVHYLSKDGRWTNDIQLIRSEVNDISGNGGFADFKFTPERGISHSFALDFFDDTLDVNTLGFMRRNDSNAARYAFELSQSDLEGVKRRSSRISLSQEYNTDGKSVGNRLFLNRFWEYLDNSRFGVDLVYFPARWDDRTSDGNGEYRIEERWHGGVFWGNDRSKMVSMNASLFAGEGELEGHFEDVDFGVTWKPTDKFSLILALNYQYDSSWLVHYSDRDLTTFKAEVVRPRLEMDLFFSAKQQFRITAQWVGIKAREDRRWQVPLRAGDLLEVTPAAADSPRDFSISRLTFQARYRWEIAPLSDLFLVYTRGSDTPSAPNESFSHLVSEAWTDRLVDIFVVKLRYRFGS